MRVLVTGAGGYVGGAVLAALAAAGHEPVAMVRDGRRDGRAATPGAVERRVGDLLVPETLSACVAGVEAVCHLAGLTRARESWDQPLRYFEVNAGGTMALLHAMEAAGVQRIVFASTGAVYGTPDQQPIDEELPDDVPHPYAASKAAAELAIEWQARAGRLAATVLRLFNVAGGADPETTRIVPRVLAVAGGDRPSLEINGDGTALRDFLHLADAGDAFVAALEHGPDVGQARRYTLGSGHGSSVLDVVRAAERVTGRRIPVVHRPPAAEPAALICDPSRALAELGWKPRRSDLDTIVRDAWATRPGRPATAERR